MIKVGDILICIKDYVFNTDYLYIRYTYSYTKNHQYIIKAAGESLYYVEADTKNEAGKDIENRFGLIFSTIKEDMNIKKFEDYFIPIAEHREQQIKSVLDE